MSVNQEALMMLTSNDVPEDIAREALRRANNDFSAAVELISTIQFERNQRNRTPAQQHATGGNSGVKPSDLTQALAAPASAGNSMDADLQKAIELSKMDQQPSGGISGGIPGVSNEDIETAKAIEKSLTEVQSGYGAVDMFENPHFRKREPGVPAGIKNIGQTCYVNSLLQTFFMIPSLRRAVIMFPEMKVDDKDPNKDTIHFMQELQKFFVALIHTNQKYVDPSNLLKKLIGRDGKPISIGDQQDVADFSDIFLKTISKGIEIAHGNPDLVKKLFYGNSVQRVVAAEQDGSQNVSSNDMEYSTLILPVDEEATDIFSLLDISMADELDYTTDKGHKTRAHRSVWLKTLPHMLMLQESRVQFDASKNSNVKRETPISFENEIYLDRYLLGNSEETTKRRVIVNSWKQELHKFEAELKSYTHYKGRNHGIDEALQSVLDYYRDRQTEQPTELNGQIIQSLEERLRIDTEKITFLRAKVAEFRHKIKTAYDDLNKAKYSLLAVWVHQGVAGSGHYWAYIKDFKNNKWIKYNDVRVNEADEESVMREAVGGYANTSAYFLIYMDSNAVTEYVQDPFGKMVDEPIPEGLKKAITEQNEKYLKDLEEYDKKAGTDKLDQFVIKYNEQMNQAEKESRLAKTTHITEDPRNTNFHAFLDSIGLTELMISDIIVSSYKTVFNRPFHEDIGTSAIERLQNRLGHELVQGATRLALDDSDTKPYKQQYEQFKEVVRLYDVGVSHLLAKKFVDAIQALYVAWLKDKKLDFPTIRRASDIKATLAVALSCAYEEYIQYFPPLGSLSQVERPMRTVFSVLSTVFTPEEPAYKSLSEKLQFLDSVASSMSEDVETLMLELSAILSIPQESAIPFSPKVDLKKLEKDEQYQQLLKTLQDNEKKLRAEFAETIAQLQPTPEVVMKDATNNSESSQQMDVQSTDPESLPDAAAQ